MNPLLIGVIALLTISVVEPDSAEDFVRQGMQKFIAHDIAGSIADFDRAAELEPEIEPQLWQRGISYYYAGEFAKGRAQFESHKAVNPHDVENAAWHYLCVARLDGVEAAREALIDIDTKQDHRVPMAEIYPLYSGKGDADAVLKAAEKADTPVARMYAHLYLGLYHEAAGDDEKAKHHMKLAAEQDAGGYMRDVARVHLKQREWKQ